MSHTFSKVLLATGLYLGLASASLAQVITPSIVQIISPKAAAGGSGTVTSISNSDGTITLSPNPIVGTGTVSLALSHANTWAGVQTFTGSDLALLGSSTGKTTLNSGLAGAGNNTLTLPITAADTLAGLGTVQTYTAAQTFTNSDLILLGSSTGNTTFTSDNAGASNFTMHVPAANDTLVDLAGSQTLSSKTLASPTLSGTVAGTNTIPLSILAQGAANTVVMNATAGTANFTAAALPACTANTCAYNSSGGAGFTANSSINAATLGGATFAAPGAIGGTTPAAITGTTIAANTNFSSTGSTAPTLAAGTIGMCAACTPTISSNGEGMFYESTIQGAILSGKGSTADSSITNNAGGMALEVLTGTVNLQTGGTLTMGGIINMVSSNITNAANILGNNANGFEALGNTASSATVPTLVPTKADTTSGLGGVANHATLIAQNTTALDTTSALVSSALAVTFSNATITLSGITTGTNADFLCRTAGGVVLIQTSACTISSRRFKENIQEFTDNALVKIDELPVYTFNLKKTEPENKDPNATLKQLGLLAEDVAKIIPLCAIYEDDMKTPKSYRQECVIAYLVKGMQDQQKEILDLQEHNTNSYVMPVQGVH